ECAPRVDRAAGAAAAMGGPQLGAMPLLVLTASEPDRDHLDGPTYGQPPWMTSLWVRQQRADLDLSTDAVQVTARSGHVLETDDPAAVVAAVDALVAAVRSRAPLACTWSWASLRA